MNTIATVAGDTPQSPAIRFRMCFDLHHKHDSREANEYSKVVILLKCSTLSVYVEHILAYLFAYLAKPLAYYGRFP